jgi:hypothetical protein
MRVFGLPVLGGYLAGLVVALMLLPESPEEQLRAVVPAESPRGRDCLAVNDHPLMRSRHERRWHGFDTVTLVAVPEAVSGAGLHDSVSLDREVAREA